MNLDHVIPLLLRHLGERTVPKNTCIVDENVDGAKCVQGSFHNFVCLTVDVEPSANRGYCGFSKSVTCENLVRIASGVSDSSGLSKRPPLRSHLICANRPAATSKMHPEQLHPRDDKYRTRGATFSGKSFFNTSGGMTVSVILDLASGAMAFVLILYLAPSLASVSASPTSPILAAE
ncbi:hypothetical protein OGATHE_003466 [Ogataea polymorpha]|uniref:Uncharacterized protein n=1 Tax=Ogataea polymorpha TaxID=460523 RepID=A0A9P8T3F0_9ASCO|nr:hypothetical protein OGATHE_003466 [Ogataea polymorpha]